MENIVNALNDMNIMEIIAFFIVAYIFIKQPLDKRFDDQNKRLDDQNKRLDDLKDLFKSELTSKIAPIEIALNNHITDTHKEIKSLERGQKEILNELKRISRD